MGMEAGVREAEGLLQTLRAVELLKLEWATSKLKCKCRKRLQGCRTANVKRFLEHNTSDNAVYLE